MSDLQVVAEDKESNATVTQTNHLISASYRLTLDAKRLLMLGISKVDSQAKLWKKGEHTVRIYADEWREYYDTDQKNVYRQMKDGLAELYESNVIVKETDEEGHSYRWISEKKYQTGEGWIEYTFTKNILLFLDSIHNTFTTYKLLNVGGLRSIHSIRIYELCLQFKATGWRKMRIEDFREALGISENQYSLFADLKKRVIDSAVKEIVKKTNLNLQYELSRRGRKYTHIQFYFSEKAQLSLDLTSDDNQVPVELIRERRKRKIPVKMEKLLDLDAIPRFVPLVSKKK